MLQLGTRGLRFDQAGLRAFVLRLGLSHIGGRCNPRLVAVFSELEALLIVVQTFLQKQHLRLSRAQRKIGLRHRCLRRQACCRQVIYGGLRRGFVGINRARQLAPQIQLPAGAQAQREVVVDRATARHIVAIGVAVGAAARQGTRPAASGAQGGQLRSAAGGHRGLCSTQPRYSLLYRRVAFGRIRLQLVERSIVINRPPLLWHGGDVTALNFRAG